MSDASARISPTAHYTGYVWYRHGLSHPALRTALGGFFYRVLWPYNAGYRAMTGGPTLETLLLARHRAIDAQLSGAIRSGAVGQVIEIAAGLSPRGLRFVEQYPDLVYVEGDLRDMSDRKRAAIEKAGVGSDHHHVVYLDALAEDGPNSLAAIANERLDPSKGTAIITEGLINYFDRDTITGLWSRIAGCLGDTAGGVYLSDVHLRGETFDFRAARAFFIALHAFARGQIHMHFETEAECLAALREAGFAQVRADHPVAYGAPPASPKTENDVVRVIDARR